MMDARLKEIQDRKIEIRNLLLASVETATSTSDNEENRSEKSISEEAKKSINLDQIEEELKALEQEEIEIRKKQEIAAKINVSSSSEEYRTVIKPKDDSSSKKSSEVNVMENKNEFMTTPEYRKAFFEYVKTGVMPQEFRNNAFSTTAAASAGAAIPTTTLNRIIERLNNAGMILPTVTRTAYQTGIAIPVSSVKPVATWVAERATSDIQQKTVGAVTFGAYKLRVAVGVSLEVDVLAIDALETTIVNNIADAMVQALETAIISGSGTGQPKGIITETPVTGQTLAGAAFDFDTLINMESKLPAQYEAGSYWVMSKATFLQLKSVKDQNKRPILDVDDIMNHTLLGRQVILCDYLPTLASATTGDVVAFIFRMSDYVLNTAYNISLKTYEDDLTEDVVRKAILLADGKVVDKNSLVTFKKGVGQ